MRVKGYDLKDLIDALIEQYHEGNEEISAHDLESLIMDCEKDNFAYITHDEQEFYLFQIQEVKLED